MSSRKAALFIASAGRSKQVAHKLQKLLVPEIEATVWDQDFIRPGDYTLDRLLDRLHEFDFGVFVFTPDDVLNIGRKQFQVTRDNVVLELGMFLGRLGRRRCVVVAPRGVKELHIATDLLGLTFATYDPNRRDGNLAAALGPVADDIRDMVNDLGRCDPATDVAAKRLVEEFASYVAARTTYLSVGLEQTVNSIGKQLAIADLSAEAVTLVGSERDWTGKQRRSAARRAPKKHI